MEGLSEQLSTAGGVIYIQYNFTAVIFLELCIKVLNVFNLEQNWFFNWMKAI